MDISVRNFSYAAAIGGSASRWLSSTNPEDYEKQCNACVAFGEAIGNVITIDQNNPNAGFMITMLATTCLSVLEGRFPESTNSSDYSGIANAVAALYTKAITKLIP